MTKGSLGPVPAGIAKVCAVLRCCLTWPVQTCVFRLRVLIFQSLLHSVINLVNFKPFVSMETDFLSDMQSLSVAMDPGSVLPS